MTEKQYNKAYKSLKATKFARSVVWIRLFITGLVFLAMLASYVLRVAPDKIAIKNADKIGEILTQVLEISKTEPLSFFSLKSFGAIGKFYWPALLEGTGWDPYIVKRVAYGVCALLGLFFLIRVGKSKKKASAFFMLFLFSVADLALHVVSFGLPAFTQDTILVYVGYLVGLFTMIITFNAMCKGAYLKRHFEKGMAIKKRELRKMYKAEQKAIRTKAAPRKQSRQVTDDDLIFVLYQR